MLIEILIVDDRLTLTANRSAIGEKRLVLSTELDPRAIERTAALVSQMVGSIVADELATLAGRGQDGC